MADVPVLHKDSSGFDWTQEDIQALVNQTGSLNIALNRLGLKTLKTLRDWGILSPPEYVRDRAKKNPDWLIRYVLMHRSIKAAAQQLNVSVTHLELVLNEVGYHTRMVLPEKEPVVKALQRFGSVLFVARLFHTTPNVIKKVVPEWKDYQDATKAGNHSTRTGTIGEQYYERLRKDKITSFPAKSNHNHKGYDLVDQEYGKVNVKSAPVNQKGKWSWEIDPLQDADAFALVQMDQNRIPTGMQVFTKQQILEGDLVGLVKTPRSNGDVGLSTTVRFSSELVEVTDAP